MIKQRFYHSISFKIWLPFAVTSLIVIIAIMVYYPIEQEKAYRKNHISELHHTAKTIALGVEISLRSNDFLGLQQALSFSSEKSEFEFVMLNGVYKDDGKKVIKIYPDSVTIPSVKSKTAYVIESYEIDNSLLKGEILVASSKARLDAIIFNLNYPVYLLMSFVLFSFLILFYLLAYRLSLPIKNIISASKKMESEDFNIDLFHSSRLDELSQLNNALISLRDSILLKEEKMLENTKKNLALSKSIVEHDKLSTIGEMAAGIAHDLSTPLGAINNGSKGILYTLDVLLNKKIKSLSKEQLAIAIQIGTTIQVETFIGGIQLMKEEKEMLDFLNENYMLESSLAKGCAKSLVKCRINKSNNEIITKLVAQNDPIRILDFSFHLQTTYNLLNTIENAVVKSTQVVKDVRSFIKAENTSKKSTVNLHDNITTVLNIFNYELKKNINVKFDVEEEITIQGHEVKLFQLWSNLIKNSIEAMNGQNEKQIHIKSNTNNSKVSVSLSNNGPEIPSKLMKKIFKKFYTTKHEIGTGLGLSIVKSVADEHNAEINVFSNKEKTTFDIHFNEN